MGLTFLLKHSGASRIVARRVRRIVADGSCWVKAHYGIRGMIVKSGYVWIADHPSETRNLVYVEDW
jgi:hypothetical protein